MLRIVMDSAGDMPEDWKSEFDVEVIPINIHFGEKTYLQGVDLTNKQFYKMADKTGIVPKTSQPTPGQFIEFYKKIADPGDTILSVHVTSKLSGTYSSAVMAAKELVGEYVVIPIDSRSGSASQGYMCRDARIMEREGFSIEKIVERLKTISDEVFIILTLMNLEYARRSGRVKALQAALASLLNIKPTVILRDGILEIGEKVRTRKRSLDLLLKASLDRWGNRLLNVAVVHSEDPNAGELLIQKVSANLNIKDLILTELSTGIAANLGPGTVGIITYPAENYLSG